MDQVYQFFMESNDLKGVQQLYNVVKSNFVGILKHFLANPSQKNLAFLGLQLGHFAPNSFAKVLYRTIKGDAAREQTLWC